MKRSELLKSSQSKEDNAALVVESTLNADTKFLNRSRRALEEQIEDIDEAIRQRLSESTPIDKSTVEVLYADLLTKRETLNLYKSFEKEFIS